MQAIKICNNRNPGPCVISKVVTALKDALALVWDESKSRAGGEFATVANRTVDAFAALDVIEQANGNNRRLATFHHGTSASAALARSACPIPRHASDSRRAYIHRDVFYNCVTGVVQSVMDAYNLADWRSKTGGEGCIRSFVFHECRPIERHDTLEHAYRELCRAFSSPNFVRASITTHDGEKIDAREFNYHRWREFSMEHPFSTIEYGTRIGNAWLIATAAANVRQQRKIGV